MAGSSGLGDGGGVMANTKYTYHFGIETLENLNMQDPELSVLNLSCEDGGCRVKTILQIPQRPEDKESNRVNYLICYESKRKISPTSPA